MTAALEKAFAKASHLPTSAQNQLAKQMLDDIAGETRWEKTLNDSQSLLEKMADKARKARQSGKTVKKGFDEL